MNVIMQLHRASVTDEQRKKYEQLVRARTRKLPRAVEVVVRLEEDGAVRRVEIVVRVARQESIVTFAEGRWFGACVTQALNRLDARIAREKDTAKARARRTRAADARR